VNDFNRLLTEPDTSFAIVGATDSPGKYGGIIYRDLKRKGFEVMAVNPSRETVDRDPAWPRVTDLPEKPTIAVFVVHADDGMKVLADCAEAGIENIWVQPGAFSEELHGALVSGGFNWIAEACVMVETRQAV
jgi:predicted CoA-binding protein